MFVRGTAALVIALVCVQARQTWAEELECGLECEAVPTSPLGLEECLEGAFPGHDNLVMPYNVPKITFPGDDGFDRARWTNRLSKRNPAVVLYAEEEEDVTKAVNCAVANGYRVSARGRNHSYQSMGTMDGHVIIDMSLTCKAPFIDKSDTGNHLLPGQKYIGTMTASAGCTNAVMLHAVHTGFDISIGAMVLIGSCPSVGITGYTLGGGSGDITPYGGYNVDMLKKVRMVLYDGTTVTASEDEHPDLFWAVRGGGGGLGVILSLTVKILQSPSPPPGEERKFSVAVARHAVNGDKDTFKKSAGAIQDYFYKVDPRISSKFGGGGIMSRELNALAGLFLGSWKEFVDNFKDAGLLEDDLLPPASFRPSKLVVDYSECTESNACEGIEKLPSSGVQISEFNSYGEALASKICDWIVGQLVSSGDPTPTRATGDFCNDLGIDDEYCYAFSGGLGKFPRCNEKVVVDAILEKMGDPTSFMNLHGPSDEAAQILGFDNAMDWTHRNTQQTSLGGLLMPELDVDTLWDLTGIAGYFPFNHLQHGAPALVNARDTALPWRQSAITTEFTGDLGANRKSFLARLVQDEAFNGDPNNLQGYYAYLAPDNMPNWRQFYWGDNYERLSKVKADTDPTGTFSKPLTVEAYFEQPKTKKKKKASKSKKGRKHKGNPKKKHGRKSGSNY